MCSDCGCRRPWDSHQDARHITLADLQSAARVSGIPLELAIQNISQAGSMQDPSRAFIAEVSRPRIVCDIDGTLAERDLAAVVALNAKFGTTFGYSDVTSPGVGWIEDGDQQDWWQAHRHDPVFLQNLAPYQDAQWALWSLRQGGYHVTVSSDREAGLLDVSRAWLQQWGVGYDSLQIGNGAKAALASAASPAEPVAFIDDNPKRVDLLGPGRTLYLLDRPWNQGVPDGNGLKRVRDWQEILSDLPAVQIQAAAKAAPTGPSAAGIAVVAGDTGRVLMLQRAMDEGDPAAGRWEFPGGKLEPGEAPWTGARREWQEELGVELPPGQVVDSWVSPDGVYAGFAYLVPSEEAVAINLDGEARSVLNPDDPDHDQIEVAAWFDPDHLPDMPALRAEVAATTDWRALQVVARKVAGREVTPGDARSTERLMTYWAEGEGAAKIRWGEGGDFDRCVEHLGKYVPPEQVKGLCANLHRRALGIWPATHAAMERGKK